MEIRTWRDVVFFDGVGVEGKTLSEALADYADEAETHDDADGICHCCYCQVWVPMAMRLEKALRGAVVPVSDEQQAATWGARKARAIAWLDLWRAERDKAQQERRPMREISYDYEDEKREERICADALRPDDP